MTSIRKDKKRIAIYVPTLTYKKLRQACDINGISMSFVLQAFIDRFVETYLYEEEVK